MVVVVFVDDAQVFFRIYLFRLLNSSLVVVFEAKFDDCLDDYEFLLKKCY